MFLDEGVGLFQNLSVISKPNLEFNLWIMWFGEINNIVQISTIIVQECNRGDVLINAACVKCKDS